MSYRSYEYRAAVVLYGGVSLAIYENGVTAAFHDACLERGIFGPLLQLLDGKFVVDVIAGASAGGINGLLLATALEKGTEFRDTANLWRQSGGLDQLLRDPTEAVSAPSLLKGDTYYVDELRKAFRKLCTSKRQNDRRLKEIDVYITGTDLTGQVEELRDTTGNLIDTKRHNLVFHLKHRAGRAQLGLIADPDSMKEPEAARLQADVLASVARITSSFPAAFPPFTVDELKPLCEEQQPTNTPALVQKALEHLASANLTLGSKPTAGGGTGDGSTAKKHALIDGGVLDNKPFEPVLNAIFHRLPSANGATVDRKLFYVEPDPEQFKQRTEFTPLLVGVNALTLPMYDSISRDLRRLDCHNARIRRFRALRTQATRELERQSATVNSDTWFAYRQTLQQSIACMLLGFSPSEVDAAKRLDELVPVLVTSGAFAGGTSACPEWDMDLSFHLRRAYHVLYCETVDGGRGLVTGADRYYVGRIIKALKLLRDVWLSEIARLAQDDPSHDLSRPLFSETTAVENAELVQLTAHRLAVLRAYLDAQWLEAGRLAALEQLGEAALQTTQLDAMKATAQAWLRVALKTPSAVEPATASPILSWLAGELNRVVAAKGRPNAQKSLDQFERVDACVFPGEFAAGLYELDVIDVARIAPQDTKLLAPGLCARDKLTGDTLAHFSAFLRRDWRTNDIAWGHADGICQIACALLSADAWQRVSRMLEDAKQDPTSATLGNLRTAFSEKSLLAAFAATESTEHNAVEIPGLAEQCAVVAHAFEVLVQKPDDTAKQEDFKVALIRAGAIAAVGRYVPLIVSDTKWQNAEWRWEGGPTRSPDPNGNALDQLIGLKLGSRPFHTELPLSLVTEYVGHAGLLFWGLLSTSFKAQQLVDSLTRRLGRFVKPVLWFVYVSGKTVRTREPGTTLVLLCLGLCCVAYAFGAMFGGSMGHAVLGFGSAFFVAAVLYYVARSRLWTLVVLAISTALVALFFLPPGVALRTHVAQALVAAGEWLQP